MPSALVTGAASTSATVTAALRRRSFQVWESTVPGPIPDMPGVDCYVQLPWGPAAPGWPADCLANRLDLLAAVTPCLRPQAAVLLAVDDDPGRPPLSEDLLRALALVLLEDLGRSDARVTVLPAAELAGSTGVGVLAATAATALAGTGGHTGRAVAVVSA